MQLTRCFVALGVGVGLLAASDPSLAQVVQLAPRATVLLEPSPTSKLMVLNPSAAVTVSAVSGLDFQLGYEADIVSGATESLKGGRLSPVDIVSSATEFDDTRHVLSGGVGFEHAGVKYAAGYSRGMESDYRSHAVSVTAGTTFLQKNTELTLSYARGEDEVCTTAFAPSDPPSFRTPLDSSTGCFTDAEDRARRSVILDNFQAGWTQAWTPVLATQLVVFAALQHGFLENPYRAVVIAPAGDQALENHPDNRLRTAAALTAKYYLRPLKTALTGGVRVYRDTWDILSQTYELEAERYLLAPLRLVARARYYRQTEALFWSDDYTGGEPEDGPRGQYWTGDRELSPLESYLVGGRAVFRAEGEPRRRIARVLLSFEASLSFDLLKTRLHEFTWGGVAPDDTVGMVWSLGLRGGF